MTAEHQGAVQQERYRRRNTRAIRTAITMLILVGIVVGAAYYGVQSLRSDPEAGPAEVCPVEPVEGSQPAGDIFLRVYNASSTGGLADDVASAMEARGFSVDPEDIANDPRDETVPGSAIIRVGEGNRADAELVASIVPGAEITVIDRNGPQVDLVVGDTFAEVDQTGC